MTGKNIIYFICPGCEKKLKPFKNHYQCAICKRKYPVESNIPQLFYPNEWKASQSDVTEKIKAFYEKTPFPNYDDLDSSLSLREKAEKGVFARLLDEQIPLDASILEAGCGTGQLSNFLALSGKREVFGADICLNSLKMASDFKKKNRIKNATFLQMNLFKPVFKNETFDFVICNGVLHHTSDPKLGFQSLARLVKKDGYIIVGLYHSYGRLITNIRRWIFNMTNNRFKFLDPRLQDSNLNVVRKNTWFMDQYKNPHESKHTIDEVLGWFKEEGFEFVSSIPKPKPSELFLETEQLFKVKEAGGKLDHLLVELGMIFTGSREGGFFVMIGRRNQFMKKVNDKNIEEKKGKQLAEKKSISKYGWHFKIVTIVFSIIASLYVTEFFLFQFFILPEPIAKYYPFNPAKSGSVIDVDQYEFKIPYKFNSQGFRDKEMPFQKSGQEKRILFVGDSTTEGFGVLEEKRYANLLLDELGRNYVGINIAQLATNPDNYFDNLITFGVALKPDVVIMGISVSNDFMGGSVYKIPDSYTVNQQVADNFLKKKSSLEQFFSLAYTRSLAQQARSKEKKLVKRLLSGNYWDLYFGKKITKNFFLEATKSDEKKFDEITASFNKTLLPYFFDGRIIPTLLIESVKEKLPEYKEGEKFYNEDDYKNTLWFIKESNKLLKKNNIRLIVVVIPDVNQVHQAAFHQVLKEDFNFNNPPARLSQLEEFRKRLDQDLKKETVEFLDVTDKLRESKELTYYLYDQHTNPKGHKIIAEELIKLFKP